MRRRASARGLTQVALRQRPAADFEDIEPASFDTVILNSVVQYFPGLEYLERVLHGAVEAVSPGGAVFVGDVRSLPLLEAFHTSVELYGAAADLSATTLQERVRRRSPRRRNSSSSPISSGLFARSIPILPRWKSS